MARAASTWTTEEDDVIRTSYPTLGPSVVAARLGRTPGSVRVRASKLGIKRLRRNMGHVKLDKKQRSMVVRRYKNGDSGVKIAESLKVSADLVYDVLKRSGVARAKTGQRNRKTQVGVIIKLRKGGFKQVEIATELGISQSAVSSTLRHAGVKRLVREFSDAEITEIVQRYEAGEAACEIAPEFCVFHKRILTILRAKGVRIRKSTRVHWTDPKGRSFHFRSKWEFWVAQHLDAAGLDWTFEEQTYTVLVDGKTRRYTPDFWVRRAGELITVIDVKGKTCVEQMKKIVLFQEQYPDLPFELWSGGVLRDLGCMVSPAQAGIYRVASDVKSRGVKTYG